MKRLILTTSDSGAGCLRQSGVADAVIPLGHRFFVGEPLPSNVEIANSLAEDDWFGRIYREYLQEIVAHGSSISASRSMRSISGLIPIRTLN